MKPYYQRSGITIYCQDCSGFSLAGIDLVVTDPPYGISHKTDYKSRGRERLRTAHCNDYPPVQGDDGPFDPKSWIKKPCCLFGGNYFADKLPTTSGWIVWDKRRPDNLDQATVELAWTNFVKGARIFRYLWHGCMRASKEKLFHPTQKPVALMLWILKLRWTPLGIVLDPYMGSGSTLVAAKQLGRAAVGIEIEEKYCEIAAKRLEQTQSNLFSANQEPKLKRKLL